MQNISPTQSYIHFPKFLLRASAIYAKLVPELQEKAQILCNIVSPMADRLSIHILHRHRPAAITFT